MPRIRYPKPDSNHNIPKDFFAGLGCETIIDSGYPAYIAMYQGMQYVLFDMSKIGGLYSDYLLQNLDSGETLWVEVKTAEAYTKKNHGLTKGEALLQNIVGDKFHVIVTLEDFIAVLDKV